jgi:CubicO group peptidase (beta-lactamase class C family)
MIPGSPRFVRSLPGRFLVLSALVLIVALAPSPLMAQGPSSDVRGTAGFNTEQVARLESLISTAIAAGKLPGCVLTVGRRDQVLLSRAFGHRQLVPALQPMTVDTIFDLASLTKPIATGTSVMLLIERGQLQLTDRVAHHWPEFGIRGKETLTLFDLLTHQSGLIADNPLADYERGLDEDAATDKIHLLGRQLHRAGAAGRTGHWRDPGLLRYPGGV